MLTKTNNSGADLTKKILLGMLLGCIVGLVFNFSSPSESIKSFLLDGVFEAGGRIFLATLKMLVVPMVFVSLVTGTASLDDIRKLGRVGFRTFTFYTMTTAFAVGSALFLAFLGNPGKGFNLKPADSFKATEAPSFIDVIANIVPSNPVEAMVKGEMLQIIFFAILFGVGVTMSGDAGKRILKIFTDLNDLIMKLVLILLKFAPFGVFFLVAKVFSSQGVTAIIPMAKYFFIVVLALLLHCFAFYGLLLKFVCRLSPRIFFKKFSEVFMFAFSTASSNATIPVSLEVAEKKIGVKQSIASFTIPFGATINMDGTAIMQGVATVFVAEAYGITLTSFDYLMVILTATLSSIGTAGVPGVGLIMLAMVFKQVGLPVEGIGLIIGVDRLLDMLRTAVNVTGDAVVSCIVGKLENEFDESIFKS